MVGPDEIRLLEITRRNALKIAMGAVAGTMLSYSGVGKSFGDLQTNIKPEADWNNPYRDIRGFNYQPSYEATGYSIWSEFRADKFDKELGYGKKIFPKINTVRYWLSFDAFSAAPSTFSANFETALQIADQHGLKVIPTLFNNWHSVPDFGGIADEMLRYWFVTYGQYGEAANYVFRPYLEKIVGGHIEDRRILLWDLCNEPHNGGDLQLILKWLKHTYKTCKNLGCKQPISVSVQGGLKQLQDIEEISDAYLIHPYFANADMLAKTVNYARKKKKGVLATECCWGSLDDEKRVKIIISDCGKIVQAGIGIMPHALQESYVSDLHRPQFGVISSASSMHFITMDGSLRPGHDIFNSF